MDDSRFTSARLFPRNPGAASAKVPSRLRRLKVLGRATAGALLVAGVAAGCSSGGGGGASASSPITICEIAATSGPFSALGTNDELGATAWAAMVNKAGGVQGHQVKLVQENDASNPATAAALVHKCVTQDHANFIFGPESTATTAAAVPVANQLQTVLLGWGSGWNGQGINDANLHVLLVPRHRQRVLRRRPGDDHPDHRPPALHAGRGDPGQHPRRAQQPAVHAGPPVEVRLPGRRHARSSTRARRTTRRRCSTC